MKQLDGYPVFALDMVIPAIDPPITRQVLMPIWFALFDLHRVIQAIMPWEELNPHLFTDGDVLFCDLTDPRVEDLADSIGGTESDIRSESIPLFEILNSSDAELLYVYGTFDAWFVHIRALQVIGVQTLDGIPCCVGGEGYVPPDMVGGCEMLCRDLVSGINQFLASEEEMESDEDLDETDQPHNVIRLFDETDENEVDTPLRRGDESEDEATTLISVADPERISKSYIVRHLYTSWPELVEDLPESGADPEQLIAAYAEALFDLATDYDLGPFDPEEANKRLLRMWPKGWSKPKAAPSRKGRPKRKHRKRKK